MTNPRFSNHRPFRGGRRSFLSSSAGNMTMPDERPRAISVADVTGTSGRSIDRYNLLKTDRVGGMCKPILAIQRSESYRRPTRDVRGASMMVALPERVSIPLVCQNVAILCRTEATRSLKGVESHFLHINRAGIMRSPALRRALLNAPENWRVSRKSPDNPPIKATPPSAYTRSPCDVWTFAIFEFHREIRLLLKPN